MGAVIDLDGLGSSVSLTLGLIALAGIVAGWVRFVQPKVQARIQARRDRDVVFLGRAEVPANRVTGEAALPAIMPLGERLDELARMVAEIHHEVHTNDGSSIKDAVGRVEERLEDGGRRFDRIDERLDRIEGRVVGELRTDVDRLDATEPSH